MDSARPVVLPSFALIAEQKERLANLYMRFTKYVLIVLLPIQSLLAVLAGDIILTFYGTKWQESIIPFQILCAYAFLRQFGATASPVFLATHKVKEWNYAIYLQLFVLALLSVPAVRLAGLIGMSSLMVLAVLTGCLLALLLSYLVLRIPLTEYGLQVFRPVLGTLIGLLVMTTSMRILPFHILEYGSDLFFSNSLILALRAFIMLSSYAIAMYGIDIQLRADISDNLSRLTLPRFKGAFLRW